MSYQYFVVPPAALAALGSMEMHNVSVFSSGGEDQPAVVLTDNPGVMPDVAMPLHDPQNGDVFVSVPAVFRSSDSMRLQALSAIISGEFVRLVDDVQQRPEASSPEPIGKEVRQWVLGRLLTQEEAATQIIAEARMIIGALQEIRALRQTDNFASGLIQGMATSLPYLGSDYAGFARMLFEELLTYSRKRDEFETNFLKPYLNSLTELKERLRETLNPEFPHANISGRIKEGILKKLMRRGWKDMKLFYDLAGLRVVVSSEAEVEASINLIVEAVFGTPSKDEATGESHYYEIERIRYNDYERGYRATHIYLRKTSKDESGAERSIPAAEIQVMTRGNYLWGEIQRKLVYKLEANVPEDVRAAIHEFCREAAVFIRACENGTERPYRPRIERRYVESIPDPELRTYFKSEVQNMYKLVAKAAALER